MDRRDHDAAAVSFSGRRAFLILRSVLAVSEEIPEILPSVIDIGGCKIDKGKQSLFPSGGIRGSSKEQLRLGIRDGRAYHFFNRESCRFLPEIPDE